MNDIDQSVGLYSRVGHCVLLKVGYSMDIMRQFACLAVSYGFVFNCTAQRWVRPYTQ